VFFLFEVLSSYHYFYKWYYPKPKVEIINLAPPLLRLHLQKIADEPMGGTNIFLQTQAEQGVALSLQSLLLDWGLYYF